MTTAVAESPGVRRTDREPKEILPGTPGWTYEDFADETYDWESDGRQFEIHDGILAISRGVKPRHSKRICPGTYGWTGEDLADPEYGWEADGRRFEIADGMLLAMPPPGEPSGAPPSGLHTTLARLTRPGQLFFLEEVDLLLRPDPERTVTPDLAVYTVEAIRRQRQIVRERGLPPVTRKRRPMYVMPEVVVESVSEGYVKYDRSTKRKWYAEAGIPHYWLLDAEDQSLEGLVLDGADYRQAGRAVAPDVYRSAALGGIEVPLAEVWPDLPE